ncbi:hypothetical protein BGZ82_007785 [Podila clonocystis]|nr:hypothetical protein BGZ82_007785 [Podila clonocystis]
MPIGEFEDYSYSESDSESVDDESITSEPESDIVSEVDNGRPKVLIVGAGLGGLMLGNLLRIAGIRYEIFEVSKTVQPMGMAVSLGSTLGGLFEQIGIFEEFQNIGKPNVEAHFFTEQLKPLITMDFAERACYSGATEYIVLCPDLYNLLYRQIPPERIHHGKKVLNCWQTEEGVTIRTWDKKFYQGDILVGADGSYSAVRQRLYESLREKGTLPASDDVPLPFECVCLVGQTNVLDPEEFPDLQENFSQAQTVLGTTQPVNWGPEKAEAMCKAVYNFELPPDKNGKVRKLGDLIDRTPKDLISKVTLEEKVFDIWHSGRTVLLGDACHKMNPAAGAGAVTAIQDAVALANWINTLQSTSPDELDTIFKNYKEERYPVAKASFEISRFLRDVMGKDTGTVKPLKQQSLYQTQRILEQQAASNPAHVAVV